MKFKKICVNVFLFLVTLLIALVFADILMKYVFFHPKYKFAVAHVLQGQGGKLEVELDPDILYKIKPDPKLGINRQGFRDRDFSINKYGKKRILFLGDSFIMALNVASEETIPKVLEKRLGNKFEVYNMGVVGFGPDQELKVLERTGLKYKPDLVVQGIFVANDYFDLIKDQLFTLTPSGDVRATATNPVKEKVFLSFSAILNQMNFLKKRNTDIAELDPILFGDSYNYAMMINSDSDIAKMEFFLMRGIIKKTKDVLAKRNIPYLVVIIPSYLNICDTKEFIEKEIDPSKYFLNEQVIQMFCEKEGIPYINLVPYFMNFENRCSLFDPADQHLSPLGNKFTTEIIARYVLSNSL